MVNAVDKALERASRKAALDDPGLDGWALIILAAEIKRLRALLPDPFEVAKRKLPGPSALDPKAHDPYGEGW